MYFSPTSFICIALLLALLLFFILGKVVARCLEWLVWRLLKVNIQIEGARFLTLYGIKISSGESSVVIKNIILRTKWSFPSSRRPVMICLGHVSIVAKKKKTEIKAENFCAMQQNDNGGSQKFISVIKIVTQYVGFYVRSMDVFMQDRPQRLFNVMFQVPKSIQVVCEPNHRCLNFSVKMTKCVLKLHQAKEVEMDIFQDITLGEVTFSAVVGGSLNSVEAERFMEDLSVKFDPIRVSLADDFFKKMNQLRPSRNKADSLVSVSGRESPPGSHTPLRYSSKNFDVILKSFDLFICDEEQRELSFSVKNVSLTATLSDDLVSWLILDTLVLQLNGFEMKSRGSKELLSFSNFLLALKIKERDSLLPCLWTRICLASCQCIYDHEEVVHWTNILPLRENINDEKQRSNKTLSDLASKYRVENILEIDDFIMSLKESTSNTVLCKAVLASLVTNFQLYKQDLQDEKKNAFFSARLENFYVYFNVTDEEKVGIYVKDTPSILPSSKKHLWGRVVELGSTSVKCNVDFKEDSTFNPRSVVIKCDSSSLIMEYSMQTKQRLATLLNIGNIKQLLQTTRSHDSKKKSFVNSRVLFNYDFSVHDINILFVGKCKDGIDSMFARIDMVSVKKEVDAIQIGAHELKIARLEVFEEKSFCCSKSSEVAESLLSLTSAAAKINLEGANVCLSTIQVNWDVESHMVLHDAISGIMEDTTELKGIISSMEDTTENVTLSYSRLQITMQDVNLMMNTSDVNSFGLQFSAVLSLDDHEMNARTSKVDVLFDGKIIVSLKTLLLKRMRSNNDVTSLRSSVEGFENGINNLWLLEGDVYVFFPHRFNFAESFDKLLILSKFLRQLYKRPIVKDKDELYADVWVKLKKLSFEIEDDPFEVKLGKNYELLCDEALQWTERERLLEERISEKRKNPGNLLSDKKVESLYVSLSEKKSKIYIERSLKLYEVDKRTRLCCWAFENVDLMILADESMNGRDRIIPDIKRIDTASPLPSDIQFTSLWSRYIKGTVSSSKFTLRDYEQPLFQCEAVTISGQLIGAEQVSRDRATRTSVVKIRQPWGDKEIIRGMKPLKYFHDLTFDFQRLEMTWGVDIQPAYTMVGVVSEHINRASVDPSLGLPFWDKMRLLLHGKLVMNIDECQLNWRATRNPYDKSELLEIELKDAGFEWTNACFQIFGDFDLSTRTASKYDDCCVLHLPALKFRADLEWHCRDGGDANNHYNIHPCAPDKLPELPSGMLHDSYAAFRSQNISLDLSFDIDAKKLKKKDAPRVLLFASTFRWFQNFQAVVWRNVSRPIRKGAIFNRMQPQQKPLSRHYRNLGLHLKFPQLSVFYWGSVTRQLGAELNLGTGSLNAVYKVSLVEHNDGLVRRPAANWSIIKLDSEIDDVTCYVVGIEQVSKEVDVECERETRPDYLVDALKAEEAEREPSKFFLGHVDRLVYNRKEFDTSRERNDEDDSLFPSDEDFTHNLVCDNFRGVWTLTNRKLSFGLIETYTRSQQLKKDLSADALKFVKVDDRNTNPVVDQTSPDVSVRRKSSIRQLSANQSTYDDVFAKGFGGINESDTTDSPVSSRRPRYNSNDCLLEQLVSELSDSTKVYVHTEENTSDESQSSGYLLCNTEDVHEQRWHFEFINSQVMLKGLEHCGCLLVTAGRTEVSNRLHRPTQTGKKLLNKITWMGHLENMQYFCTVGSSEEVTNTDNVWLDSTTIRTRRKNTGIDLTDLTSVLGSGDAIGSLVGNMVHNNTKLQRIVTQCGCDFYYVSFNDELEDGLHGVPASITPAPSPSSRLYDNQTSCSPVNTFTLRHPVLEICINSAQYALIFDIVSNILLYTEPQKKEFSDLEQRMGFYFQLNTAEDLKGTILKVQNNVRACIMNLNERRRVLHNLNEILKEKEKTKNLNEKTKNENEQCQDVDIQDLYSERVQLEVEVAEMKATLNVHSTDLRIMISAYKDFMTDRVMLSPEKARTGELLKVVEVILNRVSWRLTQPDGQLQIVDANLMDLRYTNLTMTDSAGVHSLEIGNFNMTNLMPNSPYKNVITPKGERRVGKDIAVRMYCRVKSPVGGIGVKDHFEVNLCPLNVAFTHRLYTLMMGYFFPGRAHEGGRVSVEEYDGVAFGGFEQPQQSDKDVFHEERMTSTQSSSRPNSLALSDLSLNDSPRSRISTSSVESPSALSSPVGSENKKPGTSRFYASLSETASKELDKMKERAAQTNNFVYVKIPEIPICFSYKGEKEKNLVDVHNFRLILPTLHYQNRTWTWLDLMMAVKKDYKQVLVGQLIKEKLHWKVGDHKEIKEPMAQDKTRILFGDRQSDGRKKKKKNLLSKFGFKHKGDKTDAVGLNKNSSEVETPMASLEEHTTVDDLPRKISDDEDDKENLT